MSASIYDCDSKKLAERLEDIQLQLQWIKRIKEQVDFCNSNEVLPDFEISFKVIERENRRRSST